MKYKDKVLGGLFGLACGDSINKFYKELFYVEGVSCCKNYIEKYTFSNREIGVNAKIIIKLTNAILQYPESPFDIAGHSFLKTCHTMPLNLGLTCTIALAQYEKCKDWKEAALKTYIMLGGKSSGSGSLVRAIPIALYYDDFYLMLNYSKKQSWLTHFSKDASDACAIYNTLVYRYIRGEEKIKVLKDVLSSFPKYDDIFKIKEENLNRTGMVIDVLKTVLWTFINTDNYSDAIEKSINLYKERDSVGCLAGGLYGAYYGYDNINDDWKKNIIVKNKLFKICNSIFN